MTPHVLAIEPDLRQAAIVKRIVREKVLADVTVVDSRDAALEAMRTTVPDVLLLSALLSPRDEDELIAHLRTLEHAEHLQTHTIPQLASSIGQDEGTPARGLLSAFRRRKAAGAAPAGCDPELFAEEVRTYLKRASDKKREVRDAAVAGVIAPTPGTRVADPTPRSADTSSDSEPGVTSSWASPFEWRPTRETKAAVVAAPAPAAAPDPEPVGAADPEPFLVTGQESIVVPDPEPQFVASPESIVVHDPEPQFAASPESIVLPDPAPEFVASAESVIIPRPSAAAARPKLPLVKRQAREWWFIDDGDTEPTRESEEHDSELRNVLASLSVPLHVAAFAYPNGCRIRRVRVTAE